MTENNIPHKQSNTGEARDDDERGIALTNLFRIAHGLCADCPTTQSCQDRRSTASQPSSNGELTPLVPQWFFTRVSAVRSTPKPPAPPFPIPNPPFSFLASLEAATSRLEDIAVAGGPGNASQTLRSAGTNALVGGTAALPTGGGTIAVVEKPSGSLDAADPPAVVAFDEFLGQPLEEFKSLSEQVGGLVAQQVSVRG